MIFLESARSEQPLDTFREIIGEAVEEERIESVIAEQQADGKLLLSSL